MRYMPWIFSAVCVLLFAGCIFDDANDQQAMQIKALADKDLPDMIITGKNIGNVLLEALQKNDYTLVENLPIGSDKQKFSKEKFDQLCKKMQQQGGIASFAYLGDMNMKPYHRLLWKISFKDQPGKASGNGVDVMFELIMVNLNGVNRAAGFALRP